MKSGFGPGTGRAGHIDVLADQPAAEPHPHGQITQHTVLYVLASSPAEIGQRGLLALRLDKQLVDDFSALPDATDLIELNPAVHCRGQS